MTVVDDLEEVHLADLIQIVDGGPTGTDGFDAAVVELIRWMRPRAIGFLTPKVRPGLRDELRRGIDGVLQEFILMKKLTPYLAYREQEVAAGRTTSLNKYLFRGRRTNFYSFFRSQLTRQGAFGAEAQRSERSHEAMRKTLYRMRNQTGELADYLRESMTPDGERWRRTPATLQLNRDADFKDIRVLPADRAEQRPEVDLSRDDIAREEQWIDLARRSGRYAGQSWRSQVLAAFGEFDHPLRMTTFLQLARALTAGSQVNVELLGETDPDDYGDEP